MQQTRVVKLAMSRNAIGLNIGHGLCSLSGNVLLSLKLSPEIFSVSLIPFEGGGGIHTVFYLNAVT